MLVGPQVVVTELAQASFQPPGGRDTMQVQEDIRGSRMQFGIHLSLVLWETPAAAVPLPHRGSLVQTHGTREQAGS